MKKFAEEVVKYFWIPVIMAVVSYIFFQLKDVVLGIIVLVALSAVYTLVRLYFMHKKWWLIIILVVVVFGSVGVYFLRTPDITLTINGEDVTGTSISTAAGTITINPAPQNGLYNKGAVVTLHASPSGGYDFGGWTGTDDDGVNPTMVTMNSNKDVKANFVSRFLLIINNEQVIGSFVSFPEGSVSIDPAPDSDGKYASGTTVKLTVDANTGYDWTGWSGTRDDKANPTTVIMSGGNKQVTILFEGRFALTVSNQLVIGSAVGFPEGSVTVSPAPGDDGKYAYGTRVTLTASAEPGYGWKSWTGTSGDTANPTMVTINSDKHIAINWEFRYLATINNEAISGSSMNLTGGTVAIDPAPGADGAYSKNTKVTFTATATAGYRFDRWGGDVSGTANAVTLTLNSDKNLTAIFIRLYNLTAVTSPGAGGAVSPASGTYDEGANVTITVTPAEGYRFDRWGGDASGNVTSTTITMNADKSVTAIFIKLYTLTITVSPPEGGVVSTANGTYDEGASVTITATAAEGYVFDHWEGDVTGTDATVTITMDGNKNLTAIFVPSP